MSFVTNPFLFVNDSLVGRICILATLGEPKPGLG